MHLACDHAHSFTHQEGLSYQIFGLEDSGLPQQGILPISAKKPNNGHRSLALLCPVEKIPVTCIKDQRLLVSKNSFAIFKLPFYWVRGSMAKMSIIINAFD